MSSGPVARYRVRHELLVGVAGCPWRRSEQQAEEDGAASWAHPKSSRLVLGVIGVRRNGGEVRGRAWRSAVGGSELGCSAVSAQQSHRARTSGRRRGGGDRLRVCWQLPHAEQQATRLRDGAAGVTRAQAAPARATAVCAAAGCAPLPSRALGKPARMRSGNRKAAPCRECRHWMLWWCGALLCRVSNRRGGWSKGDRSD